MISKKEAFSSELEKNATTASPLGDFCLIQTSTVSTTRYLNFFCKSVKRFSRKKEEFLQLNMYSVINDSFQSLKCLIQILDKVIYIFNPDREADQSIGNPEGFTYFPWDAGVGHDGRMFDQAFNAAKGFGK